MPTRGWMSCIWKRPENRPERDSAATRIFVWLPEMTAPLSAETLMTARADLDTRAAQASGAGSHLAEE